MKKLFPIIVLFLIATTTTTSHTKAINAPNAPSNAIEAAIKIQKSMACAKIKKYITVEKQRLIGEHLFWRNIPSTLETVFTIIKSNSSLNWALHTNNTIQIISATNKLFLWLRDMAHKDTRSIYLVLAYIYKYLNINPETHISTKPHEWTLLHTVIKYKFTNILNMFLSWGMDPNTTVNENSLLYTAALYSDINTIKILANFGVSCNCPILALFLDWKSDKEMQQTGGSLLHAAVEYESEQFSREDTVAKLLALGVDPNIKNNENETPLDLAFKNHDATTAQILLAHGAIAH